MKLWSKEFQFVTVDSTCGPGLNNVHINNSEGQLRNSRGNLNMDFLLDVSKELLLILLRMMMLLLCLCSKMALLFRNAYSSFMGGMLLTSANCFQML